MLKDVKKKLVAKKESEIEVLRYRLKNINLEVEAMKEKRDSLEKEKEELRRKYFEKGVFARFFNKSRYYTKLKILADKIMKLDMQIKEVRYYNNDKMSREELMAKILTKEDDIAEIESAYCLQSLKIDFESAVDLVSENDKTILLTEEDKNLLSINHNPFSYTDLYLVGKLETAPKNFMLFDEENEECIQNTEFIINGEEIDIFENNKKYLVIMPFDDIPKSMISIEENGRIKLKGNIKLSKNTYVLCPKGEAEQIKSDNFITQKGENELLQVYDNEVEDSDSCNDVKNTNEKIYIRSFRLMEYEGYLDGYTESIITNLGANVERQGKYGWENQQDYEVFKRMMQIEGIMQANNEKLSIYQNGESVKWTQDLGKETADVQKETVYKKETQEYESEQKMNEMNEDIAAVFWNTEIGE